MCSIKINVLNATHTRDLQLRISPNLDSSFGVSRTERIGSSERSNEIVRLTTYSGYDDAVLNDFLRKHRAVDVKHHFFVKSETQYLTLLITFHVTPQELDRVEHAETKARDSQES